MSRERPILMSAPMVRALLAGTKTQTRRIVKPQPEPDEQYGGYHWPSHAARSMVTIDEMSSCCPHGTRGDRLWVRETHAKFSVGEGLDRPVPECVAYRASCGEDGEFDYVNTRGEIMGLKVTKWTPAIFMPRWASRINLEITKVRAERLHAITEDDARADGVSFGEMQDAIINGESGRVAFFNARDAYAYLWNAINGDRGAWKTNPWVWVIEFKRVQLDAQRSRTKSAAAEQIA